MFCSNVNYKKEEVLEYLMGLPRSTRFKYCKNSNTITIVFKLPQVTKEFNFKC